MIRKILNFDKHQPNTIKQPQQSLKHNQQLKQSATTNFTNHTNFKIGEHTVSRVLINASTFVKLNGR